MNRFKNILLVYDQNRQNLEHAVRLVKDSNARLNVVDVIKEIPRGIYDMASGISSLNLKEIIIKECKRLLEEFTAPLLGEGLRITTTLLIGTPFIEVIREVLRKKHDLVIMAAEGGSGLRERLFGSTSMHLMRKCPCPVWVMRSNKQKRYARILAAVDPDPTDKERDPLNNEIMDLASSIAKMERAELHIVHAWTLLSETFLVVRGRLSSDELSKLTMQEEAMHRKQFDTFISDYKSGNLKLHVLKGDADEVIPRVARAEKADLLVMGTVCRTGIPGLFIGNTAERVLNEVDCSVLTVKPSGFVSPVKLEESL